MWIAGTVCITAADPVKSAPVRILEHIKECPEITVTWFRPDEKKDGGQYITTTGRLRRIDEFNQVLILVDDIKIPLTHVVDLDSEKLPDMNQMEW